MTRGTPRCLTRPLVESHRRGPPDRTASTLNVACCSLERKDPLSKNEAGTRGYRFAGGREAVVIVALDPRRPPFPLHPARDEPDRNDAERDERGPTRVQLRRHDRVLLHVRRPAVSLWCRSCPVLSNTRSCAGAPIRATVSGEGYPATTVGAPILIGPQPMFEVI